MKDWIGTEKYTAHRKRYLEQAACADSRVLSGLRFGKRLRSPCRATIA